MKKLTEMTVSDLVGHSFHCQCGRTHGAQIRKVQIASGALAEIPEIVRAGGWRRPFLIADCNTYQAAGHKAAQYLEQAGIPFSQVILADPALVPDEHAVGSIMMRFDQDCDLIIAVGSGTINDLSRFISFRLKRPYIVAATAPSMDGYASMVAPLITNNLKTTYTAGVPYAIIGDLDVLAEAPAEMIAAGFGDIMGKITGLADWKLAALITGEYYCSTVAELVETAVNRTISLRDKLVQRDKAALKSLMEALTITGVAMAYVGNSRPASGSEHHLAHYWEIRALLAGDKEHALHGSSVGVGARLVLRLHEYLREAGLSSHRVAAASPAFDYSGWEKEIRRAYGRAAAEVLHLEETEGKNSPEGQKQRLTTAAERWDEIAEVSRVLPKSRELGEMLAAVGGAASPSEIGVGPELLWDSLVYGKELRARYTILQLLYDLGRLHEFAERLVAEEFASAR